MTATCLTTIKVAKPWGRHQLWPGFANPSHDGEAIGEIWFDTPGRDLPLLVKYLFTSEKLSIQVHPNDALAQQRGHRNGKEECWIVLDATAGATLGLGTVRPLDAAELRASALDGSIEALMDWKPVKPGDIIHVLPGTVHAIGAGITLIEVQQNIDLTYRLYDYGRPRELHLDEGVPASDARPFVTGSVTAPIAPGREAIVHGGHFTVERWEGCGSVNLVLPDAMPGWVIPVTGGGSIDQMAAEPGQCWLIEGTAHVTRNEGSHWLFAYPSSSPLPEIIRNANDSA